MSDEPGILPPSLRLAVVGDFAGASGAKPTRIPVDRDSFDEALSRLSPALHLEVAHAYPTPERALSVELRFESWRDLAAEGVVQQVPVLRAMSEARGLLERVGEGELEPGEFGDRVRELLPASIADELASALGPGSSGQDASPAQSTPAAGTTRPRSEGAPGDAVDSILDMVDAAPTAEPSADTARRLVDGLTSRSRDRARKPRGVASGALAALDAWFASQLDAILHEPDFQRVERAWRGLRSLVDRTDFRKGIGIELVSVPLEGAASAIEELADGEEVDLVLADYELDASARDLEVAQALGAAGAQIQCPVVTALAPGFFGLESWSELAKARAPYATFDEPAYSGWRSFRDDERARWLVLVANRSVLRAGYGPDGERARGISYKEGPGGGLYGSGVWCVASVLVRAFARTGACVQISGTRNGLVGDLPLLRPEGGPRDLPVEGAFNNERREDLERIGVSVVQHYQRDIAFVGALRTFKKAERYPDPEATADAAQQVTLVYQLFASRFVRFLGRTVGELVGESRDEATRILRERVIAFVSTPKAPLKADHVGIGMEDNPDDPSVTDIRLRIQPELTVSGRAVNLLLNFSLRL